jgi:hypothetical protein
MKADTSFMRLLWPLATLLSLAFCLYIILNTVTYYLKYDVLTHTKRKHTAESTLPSVTFCSDNQTNLATLFQSAVFKVNFVRIFVKRRIRSSKIK